MARQNSRVREGTHFPAFDIHSPEANSTLSVAVSAPDPFRALVKRLAGAYGPSGSEEQVRELVRTEIKGFVDQVRADALGNLVALRRGSGNQRKKVMLAAHLDEIGVMVTFIDPRGFLRFGALGPVKPLTLLGARVQFANGAIGVLAREEKGASQNEIQIEKMFMDVGAATAESASIRVGDAACFVQEAVDVGEHIIGKGLHGRIGCAVLIETMRQLKRTPHDVYCVFTVQEEVGTRGAGAAAFAIQPDFAFVLDATAAQDVPGSNSSPIALGKGPAIKLKDRSMIASPPARQALIQAAREARVSYQIEVTPRAGGDGAPIQAAREGVPTGALAIPMRYMHTPSEMIAFEDAQNATKILLTLLSKSV